MTLKMICLLRCCKFMIRDVCSTPSNIYDRFFCNNIKSIGLKSLAFLAKKFMVDT